MKRGFLTTGLLLVSLVLLIGAGCNKTSYSNDGVDNLPDSPSTEVVSVSSTKLLIDRSFILDGVNPPFDLVTRTIMQEANKGLRIEVTSNNPVNVELMDAKGCLAKAQGESYSAYVSKSGTEVSFDYTETSETDMNNCVAIQSVGKVQVESSLKVTELTF